MKDSVVPIIMILAIIGLVFTLVIIATTPHPVTTQTASATTDYFALSCSQLKDLARQHIDRANSFDQLAQEKAADYSQTSVFLQIMQLKNCSVAP